MSYRSDSFLNRKFTFFQLPLQLSNSQSVLLKRCASESPEGLVKTDCWAHPQFVLLEPGKGQIFCIFNKLPDDANAAAPRATP